MFSSREEGERRCPWARRSYQIIESLEREDELQGFDRDRWAEDWY